MPELPEVETVVRDLRPHLVGGAITQVQLRRDSVVRYPDPDTFRARLRGRHVLSVRRHGKFIHLGLGRGESLVIHLGMSGNLTWGASGNEFLPHTHLVLDFGREAQLRYRDPRRFGRLLLGRAAHLQALRLLPHLGPEPLSRDFLSGAFQATLRGSRRTLKALLLDQAVVAGCGNIYADEACFLAGLLPNRSGSSLSLVEAGELSRDLRRVMRRALRLRGSSFASFRDGFGARGEAYEALRVYGRGGRPCLRCGATLRERQVGGRTTVYCGRCQR